MSDDLVKRLREDIIVYCDGCWGSLPEQAADRIEELERIIKVLSQHVSTSIFESAITGKQNDISR